MAGGGTVTIHRTTDAAQGEMLAEMLRREGIDARFHRVSSTLIGFPASMIEMTVDVPAETEARAGQLIADLEYGGAAEAVEREAGEEGGDEDDAAGPGGAPGASAGARRRPIFAAGFAVVLPGGAHLYARRAWTALVLASGMAACVVVVFVGRGAQAFEFAWPILLAIVACDAIAGVRATRAELGGWNKSRRAQVAGGLRLLAVAAIVGGGGRWVHDQLFAKFKVSCAGMKVFIQNRTGQPRTVGISKIEIVGSNGSEELREELGGHTPTVGLFESDTSFTVDVPIAIGVRCWPSYHGELPPDLFPDGLRKVPPEDALSDCHFELTFVGRRTSTRLDDDGTMDPDLIRASATCAPWPDDEEREAAGRVRLLR